MHSQMKAYMENAFVHPTMQNILARPRITSSSAVVLSGLLKDSC